MPRSLQVRVPNPAEIRQLCALMEVAPRSRSGRRAHALLLYATGMEAVEIARVLAVHPNTIYTDLHAFDRQGLYALQPPSGSTASLTPAQIREICRIADHPPYELGLPYGRWSLAKLRAYLLKERVCRHLSREHLRRLLKKGACASGESSARSSVMIPNGRRSWAASA
jgi:transposase